MSEQTSQYRTLENGAIDLAYYDRRARQIRSADAFSVCGLLGELLRAALRKLTLIFGSALRSGSPIEERKGEPAALPAV
ncbi:hypothetical protein [Roseibium sp.]|uniref:hypothetical protein n=1 Tax=Roseibium sp. TaxID=1936156 RepID=UPI003BA86A77